MLSDKITELFKDKPLAVQRVIAEVIRFEQEHITEKRPRFSDEIRRIVDKAASDAS
jgi:hypothetical protein